MNFPLGRILPCRCCREGKGWGQGRSRSKTSWLSLRVGASPCCDPAMPRPAAPWCTRLPEAQPPGAETWGLIILRSNNITAFGHTALPERKLWIHRRLSEPLINAPINMLIPLSTHLNGWNDHGRQSKNSHRSLKGVENATTIWKTVLSASYVVKSAAGPNDSAAR